MTVSSISMNLDEDCPKSLFSKMMEVERAVPVVVHVVSNTIDL